MTNKAYDKLCGWDRDLGQEMGTWVELGKRKRLRDRVKISPLAGTKAEPEKATVEQEVRSD